MKLIIDIPEEKYEYMKGMYHPTWAEEFIANGIPLPQNHGRLVDADEAIKDIDELCKSKGIDIRDDVLLKHTRTFIKRLPTIIEADDESESEYEFTYGLDDMMKEVTDEG